MKAPPPWALETHSHFSLKTPLFTTIAILNMVLNKVKQKHQQESMQEQQQPITCTAGKYYYCRYIYSSTALE